MTNVELFNSLLTVIGIIIGAVSLGITLKKEPPRSWNLLGGNLV